MDKRVGGVCVGVGVGVSFFLNDECENTIYIMQKMELFLYRNGSW